MTSVLDRAKAASKPYGDVPYADPGYLDADGEQASKSGKPGVKRYPLSADKVQAAWSYINQQKNAAQYTPGQLAAIKAHIQSAMKKHGHDVSETKSRRDIGVCVRGFQFESRGGGDGRTLEGYAAVFNTPTRIRDAGGDFDEVILPGAFARSLDRRTPVLQFDHGKDPRVGHVPIGAIEALSEDDSGLYVRARLFDNPVVEPVRQAIAGGAIKGMSFRFGVPQGGDKWSKRDGVDYREISDADTHELGPVVFPAYDQTSVTVRSMLALLDPAEHRTLLRELADELRPLIDFTGASDARSSDRGEPGAQAPQLTTIRQRLDDGALKTRGIIK
jgi:HK97 family phage prohead protease